VTLVVVLVLVALWIIVLAPTMYKKYAARSSVGSIDSFHHSLHLLERTGPKLVQPAYRLETAQSSTGVAPGATGLPAVSSMPGRPNLVLLQPVATKAEPAEVVDDRTGSQYRRLPAELTATVEPPRPRLTPEPLARRQVAQRRRRDVLALLAATVVMTGLLGLIPGLGALWVVTVLAALALGAFVALVAYAHSLEVQRRADARLRAAYERQSVEAMASGYDEDEAWAPRYERVAAAR